MITKWKGCGWGSGSTSIWDRNLLITFGHRLFLKYTLLLRTFAKMLKLVRPIISGEHPEAMQTGSSGCQYNWLTIIVLMVMVFYYKNHYISSNLPNCLLKTTRQSRKSSFATATPNTATIGSTKRWNKNDDTTVNLNSTTSSPYCPDCQHLLANNTNFDNNCFGQKLVSTKS